MLHPKLLYDSNQASTWHLARLITQVLAYLTNAQPYVCQESRNLNETSRMSPAQHLDPNSSNFLLKSQKT